MNILWITSVYPSDQQPGSGVFHETQVQALLRLGVDVTVICPVPRPASFLQFLKKQYRSHTKLPSCYERKGVTVYRPSYLAFPGQLRWAQPDKRIAASILKTMTEYGINPDLIHAHFAMPSGGAARIVSEQKKISWLLTLHGSDVNVYPAYSHSARIAFFQSVKAADRVLAVGDSLRRKTLEMTGKDSVVLPIGVDLTQFKQPNQSKMVMRKILQLPHDKKIITFVGRLIESKGVFELAAALEKVSEEMVVVFIGDGPAKERLMKHPEYNRRLILKGEIENKKVKEYLFASDYFALPSYTEGFPTVVIEAIAMKVPVICTAVGGVPDLFGKHRDQLIEPKSVTALVGKIQEMATGKIDTTSIQDDLYEHIQQHYHAKENAILLKDEYKRTIESVLTS